MRRLCLIPFAFVILASGILIGDQPSAKPGTPAEPLRTAGAYPVEVRNLRVDLTVDLKGKAIDARATLSLAAPRKVSKIVLDAEELAVSKVTLVPSKGNAAVQEFFQDGQELSILFSPALSAGDVADLVIDYKVQNPKHGLHFFAPSKSEPDVPLTVWSQGESIETRAWIPCFDRPNIRQSSELVVTVPAGNEVLSNGKLLSKKTNAEAKTVTFHWKQDEPHPAYLITMVVGPFAIVEDKWRDRPVLYYVPPNRKDDARRTFGRTPEMMELFSKKFGVDYPWNKYAQVVAEQFGGGMENTSATTLGGCLLDERTAQDGDADDLIAHELGHQWWGDLLTCRDWSHLWLNEGFATYCECLWVEHREGADGYSLDVLSKARRGKNAVPRPVVDRHYPSPDSMFDDRVYPKGGFILHMLRLRLGDDVFFAGLKKYLTEHRLKSVETVDFRRCMEQVSGKDLERFFYDWTERAGHPKLNVVSSYDAEAKRVVVKVKQTQGGEPFHFPLKIRVTGSPQFGTTEQDLKMDSAEETFSIPAGSRPLGVEVDPLQGVLAEIQEEKARDWWSWQLTNGTTPASRIMALDYFSKRKKNEDRELLIAALGKEKVFGVARELMESLSGIGGPVCRDALLEVLKSKERRWRKMAAASLASFENDEKVGNVVRDLLAKGDPSLGMEVALLRAFAKQHRPDTVKVLSSWLEKPTNHENLKSTALNALGESKDPAALETLIAWNQIGKPIDLRLTAIRSLGTFVEGAKLSEKQRTLAVECLTKSLSDEAERVRKWAIFALRNPGVANKDALKKLEELADHDPVESISEEAKKVVKAIRSKKPDSVDFNKLKEEFERLKKDHDELRNRLEKQEKSMSK